MQKKIVVGLGNPEKEYEHTYHNVGIIALHAIATKIEEGGTLLAWKSHKNLFRAAVSGNIVLIEPLTFMNESGAAIREALKKYEASPADLIVIHDESDLPVGTYKLSSGRSSAGHNGVRSVMEVLGTQAFTRARIGIRPKEEKKRTKAGSFVLKTISQENHKILDGVFAKIAMDLTDLRSRNG